jgi:hypothetical protein
MLKKLFFVVVVCLCLASASLAQTMNNENSPKLTPEERQKVVNLLKQSFDESIRAVEDVSDAQWNYKPSIFKWSVGQVSELIMIFDGFLLGLVDRLLQTPVNPNWAAQTKGKSELMDTAVLNRSVQVQAPEPARPMRCLQEA